MATVLETRPASKSITSPDPWTERPAYDVPVAALVFGVRIRHKVLGGTWKVVRAATRLDSTSRYHVRVREQAADGSLFGPVLSWRVDEIAALVTDASVAPVAAPVAVQDEVPAAVAVETADHFTPATSRRRHGAVRAFPALHHLALAEAAV